MAWFKRIKKPLEAATKEKKEIPAGVWVKCEGCSAALFSQQLDGNLRICPKCHYHFKMGSRERIEMLADEGSFSEMDANLAPGDPLSFAVGTPYPKKIQDSQRKTSLTEAVVCGRALMDGHPVVLAVMDFGFIGGSMGSVVGEKVSRAAALARESRIPLIAVNASGGARMQEGMLSLMQMAKTSAAVERLRRDGGFYISVLANPTTGGVLASFAMLGDVILAEPGAHIGFAGPRVIEQTIKQKLPHGFQTAEFMRAHGFVDRIVPRDQLKRTIVLLLEMVAGSKRMEAAAAEVKQ